jgi:hypothetical protein
VAVGDELPHHDLCVNKVFWAAETYKSDFQGVGLKDSIDASAAAQPQTKLASTS